MAKLLIRGSIALERNPLVPSDSGPARPHGLVASASYNSIMAKRVFDSDRGIDRSSYHAGLSAAQIDALIVQWHNAGVSQSRIARELRRRGCQPATQQGISLALRRIAAGRVGAGPRE